MANSHTKSDLEPLLSNEPTCSSNITSEDRLAAEYSGGSTATMSIPVATEASGLLSLSPQIKYGSMYPSSWSEPAVEPAPTQDPKLKRVPYHHPLRKISTNEDPGQNLYTRMRYYSRLRAPAPPSEQALVVPDHIVPIDLFLPFIPGSNVLDAEGRQSSIVTVIAIWNTMMGTSLLAMPWAFGEAGFANGILIMVVMAAMCVYTSYRLLVLQNLMGIPGDLVEFGELCTILWSGTTGMIIQFLSFIFSILTLIGAQMVYWVLMSNFLYNTGLAIYNAIYNYDIESDFVNEALLCPANESLPSLISSADDSSFKNWWIQDETVPLFLIIPFLILLNIKNAKIFTYFNSLGAISVFAMLSFVFYKAISWGININFTNPDDSDYSPMFKSTFPALCGTLSLAYFIHNCIITIMKNNKHQQNNVRDLSAAFFLVAMTYIPVGVIFYTTFPLPKYCIAQNFLDNFPPHYKLLSVIRSFLLFQMLTVYPLLGYFIRSQLFSYICGSNYTFVWWHTICVNCIMMLLPVLIAIFYPNIGVIIRWVGALAGLAYVFVFPCLTYLVTMHYQGKLRWYNATPHIILILFGIANCLGQFFLTE